MGNLNMSTKLAADVDGISFRMIVNLYRRRAQEIEAYLSKKPNEWGKFQSEFNSEVNSVFREIMKFEKENIAVGREDRVYKLKRIFVNRIKSSFVRGEYAEWSVRRPYGYAGDFKIIEDIYRNNPITTGFERLFDNYFMMSAISIAVRNRKNDFKRVIIDLVSDKRSQSLRIMDLACGPCREIREIFSVNSDLLKNVVFDCYDNEEKALEFSADKLSGALNINYFKENATRIAFRKNISSLIDKKYDLIYTTGLFDYFEERLAIRLVENLKKLLNPNGIIFISDVRDKYSNPSVHYMEWAGDWNLVYRDDESFKNIFLKAGFQEDEIETYYEQQGILQYIKASNKQSI